MKQVFTTYETWGEMRIKVKAVVRAFIGNFPGLLLGRRDD